MKKMEESPALPRSPRRKKKSRSLRGEGPLLTKTVPVNKKRGLRAGKQGPVLNKLAAEQAKGPHLLGSKYH